MNVVIAGGGVAGLTTAAALRRLPFVKSIIVFEPVRSAESCQVDNEKNVDIHGNIASKPNHFNGLWGPSLRCLEYLDIYGNIKDHLHAVRQSGYKDVSGRWLAQPTVGLKELPGSPSLAFIDNDILLSALRKAVLTKDPRYCEVNILWGDTVLGVTRNPAASTVTVTDSNQTKYTADLLVAADGTFSSIFAQLYPTSSNRPRFRGYKVYRGYSEKREGDTSTGFEGCKATLSEGKSAAGAEQKQEQRERQSLGGSRICDFGFQTWGPTARFACVPTIRGNAWYLAVPAKDVMGLNENASTSSSNSSSVTDGCRSSSLSGPFSNGSHTIEATEFSYLKSLLLDWHQPIGNIIDGTIPEQAGTGVRVCDAYSFSSRDTVGEEHSSGSFPPVVFVGDAAHTLDPILAQGAGVAIEDSVLLVQALQRRYRFKSYDSFTVSSYGEKEKDVKGTDRRHLFQRDAHTVDMKAVLLDVEQARYARVRLLEVFSDVSQVLGQVQSPWLCGVRDFLIYHVPSTLKGAVFDIAIRAVSNFKALK